jgi:hypothetical protein
LSKATLAREPGACYIPAMSAQVLFNPLTYIDRLTRGGFSPEQARASAEALETAFSESVATKSDLEAVKHELQSSLDSLRHETKSSIETFKHETTSSIEAFKHETTASIEALKHETASSFEGVRHDISLLKLDMGNVRREVGEAESRLRFEFKRDISESESRVRLEIAQSKNETLRWMFGFVIVLIGAIFTIVKFVR